MELEQPTDEVRARFVQALNKFLPNTIKDLPIEDRIKHVVSEMTKVSVSDMQKRTRIREICEARHMAMFFIKEHTNYSLKSIGEMFEGRDHTTVLNGIGNVNDLRETDKKYLKLFEEIEVKVKEIL